MAFEVSFNSGIFTRVILVFINTEIGIRLPYWKRYAFSCFMTGIFLHVCVLQKRLKINSHIYFFFHCLAQFDLIRDPSTTILMTEDESNEQTGKHFCYVLVYFA